PAGAAAPGPQVGRVEEGARLAAPDRPVRPHRRQASGGARMRCSMGHVPRSTSSPRRAGARCAGARARDMSRAGGRAMESELLLVARQRDRSCTFEVDGLADNFWVVRFTGSEAISSLYESHLDVAARHIEVGELVGRNATLKM